MIYGDTAHSGVLSWLTVGTAQIPPWRNGLAMALAFPGIIFYGITLFSIAAFLSDEKDRRGYRALTTFSLSPWLCLHLFYIIILYVFAWMSGHGYGLQHEELLMRCPEKCVEAVKDYVRSVDLARHMGFTKPSISHAVKMLKHGGFLTVNDDGQLDLTVAGLEVAERIYERHRLFSGNDELTNLACADLLVLA